VESKSFSFGLRLVEGCGWPRGVDVILGWQSLFWLMQVLEGFIKGEESSKNWRTYCQGRTSYVVQRSGNKHGRFIELLKYGGGGR